MVWREGWGYKKITGNNKQKKNPKTLSTLSMINKIRDIRNKVRQKLKFMPLVHNTHRKQNNTVGFIVPENRYPCSTLMETVCYYALLVPALEF